MNHRKFPICWFKKNNVENAYQMINKNYRDKNPRWQTVCWAQLLKDGQEVTLKEVYVDWNILSLSLPLDCNLCIWVSTSASFNPWLFWPYLMWQPSRFPFWQTLFWCLEVIHLLYSASSVTQESFNMPTFYHHPWLQLFNSRLSF